MVSRFSRLGSGLLSALALTGLMSARANEPKADAKDDAKPIKLAFVRKAGDVFRYKTMLTNTVNGTDVPSQSTVTFTTKEVKPGGEVVVIATPEGGSYTLNGVENAISAGSPITYTYDKLGHLSAFKPNAEEAGLLTLPLQYFIAIAHNPLLPEKPMKPGDTWKTDVDNPAAKDKKISVASTFVAAEKVDGMDAWKIRQAMEAETDTGDKFTCEVTSWLDASNGQLIKSEETMKGVPTQYGKMDWEGKTVRVKPAEKKPTDK